MGGPITGAAKPATMPTRQTGLPPRFYGQYGFAPVSPPAAKEN
jgi:hypothetical protein